MHCVPPDILQSQSFHTVPQEQCRQAEVIVFCVNMMWLQPNVCGSRWAVLPWEINSIGVNTDDWDGRCEVGVGQGVNVYVCMHVCFVCTHTHLDLYHVCGFILLHSSRHFQQPNSNDWGIKVIGNSWKSVKFDKFTHRKHSSLWGLIILL